MAVVSIFDDSVVLGPTTGVYWKGSNNPVIFSNQVGIYAPSTTPAIHSGVIDGAASTYVYYVSYYTDNGIYLDLSPTPGTSGAALTFTAAALSDLRIVVEYKDSRLVTAFGSANVDPYSWNPGASSGIAAFVQSVMNDPDNSSEPIKFAFISSTGPVNQANLTVDNGVDLMPTFSTSVSDKSYQVGDQVGVQLPAAGGGDLPLTYSLAPTVPGLTFNPTSRFLSGTVTTAGTYNMTLTVSDSDNDTDTVTFAITVTVVQAAVSIFDDSIAIGTQGVYWKDEDIPSISVVIFDLVTMNFRPNAVAIASSQIEGAGTSTYVTRLWLQADPSNEPVHLIISGGPDESPAVDPDNLLTEAAAGDLWVAVEYKTHRLAFPFGDADMELSTPTPGYRWGTVGDALETWIATVHADPDNETTPVKCALVTSSGNINFDDFTVGSTATPPLNVPIFASRQVDAVYALADAVSLTLPFAVGSDSPISYTFSPSIPGLTFNASTRVLSGNPTTLGTYAITYTATDNNNDSVALQFTVFIRNEDMRPGFAIDRDTITLSLNESFSMELPAATGGDPPVSYHFGIPTPGISFDPDTRILSGTPTETGEWTVYLSATDVDYDYGLLRYTLTVLGDQMPAFQPNNVSGRLMRAHHFFQIGQAVDLLFPVGMGGDGALTYSMTPSIPGLTFSSATRRLTGSPLVVGNHDVIYTVTDADGDATNYTPGQPVKIFILPATPVSGDISVFDHSIAKGSSTGVYWKDFDLPLIREIDNIKYTTATFDPLETQIDPSQIVGGAVSYVQHLFLNIGLENYVNFDLVPSLDALPQILDMKSARSDDRGFRRLETGSRIQDGAVDIADHGRKFRGTLYLDQSRDRGP